MSSASIYEENEFYQPFPELDDTIISEIDKKYLLPIGILHHQGDRLLIAAPIGDEEGYISRVSPEQFEIGNFHLTYSLRNGEWSIDADLSLMTEVEIESRYWSYKDVMRSYQENRKIFSDDGILKIDLPNGTHIPKSLFEINSIAISNSNWYSSLPKSIPHSLIDSVHDGASEEMVIIRDLDGNNFEYIGVAESNNYSDSLSSVLHFFYEKNNKRIMVITEYT